jgi:hypothetical protein
MNETERHKGFAFITARRIPGSDCSGLNVWIDWTGTRIEAGCKSGWIASI